MCVSVARWRAWKDGSRFGAVIRRFPDLRPANEQADWGPNFAFRGLNALLVRIQAPGRRSIVSANFCKNLISLKILLELESRLPAGHCGRRRVKRWTLSRAALS